MRNMLARHMLVALISGAAASAAGAWSNPAAVVTEPRETIMRMDDAIEARPVIQLAILLDTSGSMQGLIEQAKAQLWTIVNELAMTRRDGMQPEVYVSLYEYGKSTLARDEGYLRMILPLSRDLDSVSSELFALTTNGGEEYCGWVIQAAVHSLQWSTDPRDLRMIVIAGNEPFTQGPVDYRESIRDAVAKGIIVNTIHCGNHREAVQGGWQDAATLAKGAFSNIDHNAHVMHIEAPQDEDIVRLNIQLNETYLPYGQRGTQGAQLQLRADAQAAAAPAGGGTANVAQRTLAKAEAVYCNRDWDLIDACREASFDLAAVADDDLPEQLRGKSIEEKQAYIESLSNRREAIQQQIRELGAAREAYVIEQRRKLAEQNTNTLGDVLAKAIRLQATQRGFELTR